MTKQRDNETTRRRNNATTKQRDNATTKQRNNAKGGFMERIKSYKDLDVYKLAMDTAMRVFELTKYFPKEERYSLTDQIRRSTRSVCANIAEAWRKRRYRAAFIAKLNDAETEACETQVHLEISCRCTYLDREIVEHLDDTYEHIMAQIINMIQGADHWIIHGRSHRR